MKKKLLALLMACVLAVSSGTVLQPVTTYAVAVDKPDFIQNHLKYAKSRSVTAEICYANEMAVTLKSKGKVTITITPKSGKKTSLGLAYMDPENEDSYKVLVKEKKRSKLTYTYTPKSKDLYFIILSDEKIKKVKATIKSKNKKAIVGNDFAIG